MSPMRTCDAQRDGENCGRRFLCRQKSADFDRRSHQGGALRVPEPINTFVQGDYSLKTLGCREMGLLHIRQRACWDVRRLVLALGGEAGDTLVIILNHRDHSAAGLLGNDDVVAQVASGFAEKLLADASRSAGKDSERCIA